MILYHGTTAKNGRRIEAEGFIQGKPNWPVKSKRGFIYLSDAYAPFYAMYAKQEDKDNTECAIVAVEVDEQDLFPDDDFVMLAVFKKPVYKQKDLDKVRLFDYKHLAGMSLKHMGNACAPVYACKVVGVRCFGGKKLLRVCDPTITPINYKLMGGYYRKLTEHIYNGGKPEDFLRMTDFFKEQV